MSNNKPDVLEALKETAEFNPSPFYWLDLEQKYLGVNQYVLNKLGLTSFEKDLAGKTPYDIYPKEMAENIVQHHQQVIETGKPLSAEETVVDINGKVIYVHAAISPLRNNKGNIIGTVGVSLDVTAEKKKEISVKKARVFEHLEKIVQFFPVPVYWLDTDGIILGINDLVLRGQEH